MNKIKKTIRRILITGGFYFGSLATNVFAKPIMESWDGGIDGGGSTSGGGGAGADSGGGAASNGLSGSGSSVSLNSFNVKKYLIAPGQNSDHLSIGQTIVTIINYLSLLLGSFAFLALVVGGIILVTSAGREHSTTRGKDIIKYAIMGLIITLGAYFITEYVRSIFYDVK